MREKVRDRGRLEHILEAIESIGKQSLRAVLRTLIKMYTFAPNFKFGTK